MVIAAVIALVGVRRPAFSADLRNDVKAAYLYNFLRFCQWPASAPTKNVITLGIVGDDDFAADLSAQFKERQLDGKTVSVISLEPGKDVARCDAVYFRGTDKRTAAAVVKAAAGLPILTVGDSRSFVEAGGMINFVERDGAMRFAVNSNSVQKSGLAISSQMLQYAIIINEHSGSFFGRWLAAGPRDLLVLAA